MELILKYFPNLSDTQREQFAALKALYEDWNSKINVISRKDMDNFYEHHVLHSLAIAHEIRFREGTKVLDLGTGGGFPGIPLAIMFPDCQFKLIDENFRETFLELFGGGKASVILEDENDPLECGIEIKVQPPGKAVSNISLLSGGEKAFVAIALYFAILKVRPTPFCVMDEI